MVDARSHFARVVNELVAEHSVGANPDRLYHYTSGAGLHGILRSTSLRGGHYAFMNDPRELQYAQALLAQVIGEIREQSGGTLRDAIVTHAFESGELEKLELYMVCFCETPDLLSQWRGYGGEKSRYCIEFETSRLKAADPYLSPVTPVNYDQLAQREIFEKFVDHFVSEAESASGERDDVIKAAADSLFFCTAPLLPQIKNPSFAEEREWRYSLLDRRRRVLADIDFVDAGGVVKPFLTLLRGSTTDDRLPITRVIAGGTLGDPQAEKAARLLLDRFGYADVPVVASEVPLRF